MFKKRLYKLMNQLNQDTVLNDVISPVHQALDRVRFKPKIFKVLSMPDFITLGILRHLEGIKSVREQVQKLMHLEPGFSAQTPLARSTWSDALSSKNRLTILRDLTPHLVETVMADLPDRLADIPGLGNRPVYAMDGTYQIEASHYGKKTPKQGGEDNPKGHGLLTFYDIRLGCARDVYVQTRSQHEIRMLDNYDEQACALTQHRGALWLVDRGFINAPFWDNKKQKLEITMITRMKSNLTVLSREVRAIDKSNRVNKGVEKDELISLKSSAKTWRLIRYSTRRGDVIEFLSNDLIMEPGLITFMYSRRWDEEKIFDTWKNDFSLGKAWGISKTAIEMQARLAMILSLLLPSMMIRVLGPEDSQDDKALDKQDRRQESKTDGTDRPDWAQLLYRHASKISRQVLRFFRYCFHKKSSPRLYAAELRPMLAAYL